MSHFLSTPGVIDGRFDLALVANDAGVQHKALDGGLIKRGNTVDVKAAKRQPKGFAFLRMVNQLNPA